MSKSESIMKLEQYTIVSIVIIYTPLSILNYTSYKNRSVTMYLFELVTELKKNIFSGIDKMFYNFMIQYFQGIFTLETAIGILYINEHIF